ncbi:MAG TPA: hypothetical protein VLA83_11035, partial [Candidatus Binatia bacterium]|nr:hypothetical protein [Candidatus Binatia bacterium]
MADQEKDREMDEMLDSLLANYSSAEPRPGLEARILANLREAEEKEAPHGWWNFKWIWAGLVAAAIVMAAVLINGRHHVEPPAHVLVKNSQPASQPEIQPQAAIARQEAARIHRRKPSTPAMPQNALLALTERPA